MVVTKRKKNLPQKSKGAGSKNIKPDIWKRIGFEPHWRRVSEMHKADYEKRMKQPEGAGTSRSQGSNERLKKLMHYY